MDAANRNTFDTELHAVPSLSLGFVLSIPPLRVWAEPEWGRGGFREEVGKRVPFALSLSSPSFLPSRTVFDAPRFPTSHSNHFFLGPTRRSGSETQSESLQPGGDSLERLPGAPDASPRPVVAGGWLPTETLLFPPRLRHQPKVP